MSLWIKIWPKLGLKFCVFSHLSLSEDFLDGGGDLWPDPVSGDEGAGVLGSSLNLDQGVAQQLRHFRH